VQFFVKRRRGPSRSHSDYPYVVLARDNWDDYGFKTSFEAEIHLGPGKTVDLRAVKILKRSQESGPTQLDSSFTALDDTYCSLGQELAYYESLQELPDDIRDDYLHGLRDAAANPAIAAQFEEEPGFGTSLLRSGSAARALEDAPALLQGHVGSDEPLEFVFHTKFGANEFGVPFRFRQIEELPGRMNAVIGYNGTGKTQLLANLAWVAKADLRSRNDDAGIARYGRLDPVGIRFGRVVAISYSAFDTFDLPRGATEDDQAGYTYCGLRRHDQEGATTGLKEPDEIITEIADALRRIDTPGRRESLHDALEPLREEPSFKRAGYDLDLLAGEDLWREEFELLSTGHKISVNIIVQLVAALQQNSLVLLDEPEAHLHPPLLAALMKGIGAALNGHRSVAVVATHSPVVLQEIAGCYAHVLRRHGSMNSVEEPSIETFGENIGLLTSHVFNLDNSHSDYVGILRELSDSSSLDEIEALFERGLSSQARALLMQTPRHRQAL